MPCWRWSAHPSSGIPPAAATATLTSTCARTKGGTSYAVVHAHKKMTARYPFPSDHRDADMLRTACSTTWGDLILTVQCCRHHAVRAKLEVSSSQRKAGTSGPSTDEDVSKSFPSAKPSRMNLLPPNKKMQQIHSPCRCPGRLPNRRATSINRPRRLLLRPRRGSVRRK